AGGGAGKAPQAAGGRHGGAVRGRGRPQRARAVLLERRAGGGARGRAQGPQAEAEAAQAQAWMKGGVRSRDPHFGSATSGGVPGASSTQAEAERISAKPTTSDSVGRSPSSTTELRTPTPAALTTPSDAAMPQTPPPTP